MTPCIVHCFCHSAHFSSYLGLQRPSAGVHENHNHLIDMNLQLNCRQIFLSQVIVLIFQDINLRNSVKEVQKRQKSSHIKTLWILHRRLLQANQFKIIHLRKSSTKTFTCNHKAMNQIPPGCNSCARIDKMCMFTENHKCNK